MNTFWLKIAGIAVVALGLIIIISIFSGSEKEPQTKSEPKTFRDVIREDDKRLRAEPEATQENEVVQESTKQQRSCSTCC